MGHQSPAPDGLGERRHFDSTERQHRRCGCRGRSPGAETRLARDHIRARWDRRRHWRLGPVSVPDAHQPRDRCAADVRTRLGSRRGHLPRPDGPAWRDILDVDRQRPDDRLDGPPTGWPLARRCLGLSPHHGDHLGALDGRPSLRRQPAVHDPHVDRDRLSDGDIHSRGLGGPDPERAGARAHEPSRRYGARRRPHPPHPAGARRRPDWARIRAPGR